MSILKKIGLETAKKHCFYPVSKDSAVLVGIKCNGRTPVTIPERIGKYTVRGIDDPFCPGRIGDAYASLNPKQQQAVHKALSDYQLLSKVALSRLPTTVEYIGHSELCGIDFGAPEIRLPSNIRYIRSLALPPMAKTPTPILLPDTVRYLGEFSPGGVPYNTSRYYSLDRYEASNPTPPHLRLSDYFGREVSEEPRVADGAFARIQDLMYLTLPKEITHIGAGAFAHTTLYSMELPEGVTHIGAGAFAGCKHLGKINLPDSLTELAPDAFSDCASLHLPPPILKRLKNFPDAYEAIVVPWQKQIKHHLQEGDRYLYRKPMTSLDKLNAYQHYEKALKMDPFCIEAAYSLNQLFLTYQIPNGAFVSSLEKLQKFVLEHNSTDVGELIRSTIVMLDCVCVILSDPDEIITQRHVYGLNGDQSAAAELLRFLLDTVERHPKISFDARSAIRGMVNSIVISNTRNQTAESKKEFQTQKKRYHRIFGAECNLPLFDRKYHVSLFHPEDMMLAFRDAMMKENDGGFYDAELWLEILRTFNPKTEFPDEFTKMQARQRSKKEAEEWQAWISAMTFPPVPYLPTQSFSIPESSFEMDDVISEYWAGVAAKQAAAEIESMWGDLNDIGFWDDTSWQ